MGDGERALRIEIKRLHEEQSSIDVEIGKHQLAFDAATQPLRDRYEAIGVEMDRLLGQSRSWIVGRYGDDGLPVFE